MKNVSGLTLAFLLPLLLSSCFFKSDDTGTADDVKEAMICHTPKGDYLITHEEIFHATSKSSGGSGSYTSGSADYRFTVRELSTGKLVKRQVTGDRSDDILPLGYDGTRLWCYGADKSIGLHARDPITLQIVVTQAQIVAANPALANNMTTPEVTSADGIYSYDNFSGRVIITDLQGNFLALDPATLHAVSIPAKPKSPRHAHDASSTSAYRSADDEITLNGEPRKQIALSHGGTSRESYLNGTLLLDQDGAHLAAIGNRMRGANQQKRIDLQRSCDSLLRLYPALSDERNAYWTIHDSHIPDNYFRMVKTVQRLNEDSTSDDERTVDRLSEIVLGCDSNFAYLLHANNLSDTSGTLISRAGIKDGAYVNLWTTLIPGIYFDPSKGIKSHPLTDVFTSGNPDFDFQWYGVEGNVFVGVKMLFAFGIDIPSGKLLWKEQL